MKTVDITPISLTQINLEVTTTEPLSINLNVPEDQEKTLPEILFITSFPPRECGIAKYSQDLIEAINQKFGNSFNCVICALETDKEIPQYQKEPKYILNTDNQNSFIQTALEINKDEDIQLVVIQHEFGFFSKNDLRFQFFYNSISKPIVFAFHTVLPNPNPELKAKVQDMTRIASYLIVMTQNAAAILTQEYEIPETKIRVIPHGTHLVTHLDKIQLKEKYNLTNKKVLSTFGLLSSGKGIETTLEALPTVIKQHPEVVFLVLGKTHPSIVEREGEQYRIMLQEKVCELNIEKHVRFINEYIQLPILLEYLQLSDIYLFTSKDPNQAVSGTFAYAVSCGCPVISTPIPHAKEVLNNNIGIIVDFGNPVQLATAISSLLNNENLRAEISSNSIHKMASTAWQNSAIAHALLFQLLTKNKIQLNFRTPDINLKHIKKLTTSFSMIQFSKIAIPNINSGHTLDDNSRGLIALCRHYELFQHEKDLDLINIYLNFLNYCLQPNGTFLNYVNDHQEFTQQNYRENLEDSNGRAIWALGYVTSLKGILPHSLCLKAESLLQITLTEVVKIHSTRAMAFIIKGLYYQDKKENQPILELFANRLVQMYKHEKTNNWHWFENYLTYGNSLLPEAMLCAYLSTNNVEYKSIAKESFDFLLSKIFVEGKIKVISNKGWHIKKKTIESIIGGEQPIDVAYTVMALEKFYQVFKLDDYQQKANIAFNWFLGDNHLHQIVYNPCTGGCYDGVEEYNINLNQGAESTVSYLMARLSIENFNLKTSHSLQLHSTEILSENFKHLPQN